MTEPVYRRTTLPGLGTVLVPRDHSPDDIMRDLIAETPALARFTDPDFPARPRGPSKPRD